MSSPDNIDVDVTIPLLLTRVRGMEDRVLVIETNQSHIEDSNKQFREEVRGELGKMRVDLERIGIDMRSGMQDLSRELRETRSIKTWVIGAIAATGASGGSFFAINMWNTIKTLWMH